MNRDDELEIIEQYVQNNGARKGPLAFVAKSVQADVPTRRFEHSQVVRKWKWKKSTRNKKTGMDMVE